MGLSFTVYKELKKGPCHVINELFMVVSEGHEIGMSEDRATYLGLVSLAEQFRIKAQLPLALQCLNAAANLTNIRKDDKSSHISKINI